MDADSDNITGVGFANCLTRDGQGGPSSNLPMGGFKHTGAADGTSVDDYATFGQLTTRTIGQTVQISNQSAASSASIIFGTGGAAGLIDSTYDFYEINFRTTVPTTAAGPLVLDTSKDGGANWIVTGYSYANFVTTAVPGSGNFGLEGQAAIILVPSCSNNAAYGVSGRIRFNSPSQASLTKNFGFDCEHFDGSHYDRYCGSGACLTDTGAINAVRIRFSNGTMATGNFVLLAYRK